MTSRGTTRSGSARWSGLLWWGETGSSEGNAYPFEHLDLVELHPRALARRAYFRVVPDQPPRRIEW